MQSVRDFLQESAMAPEFALPEILTEKILDRMDRGLGEDGEIMLPSFAPSAGMPPLGIPVAVLDVGGTYLRRARVTFTQTEPQIDEFPALETPGRRAPLDWEGYIEALADAATPLLENTDFLCLCFSHPAQMTERMDGRALFFSKEVVVTGARGRLICRDLRECLKRRGIRLSATGLVNDTVAALLGGAAVLGTEDCGGYDALVYATGLNLCLELPAERIRRLGRSGDNLMPVNTEAGHFDVFPGGEADHLLDQRSAAPGEGLFEKKVSGRYFGETVLLTLHLAAKRGVFTPKGAEAILGLRRLTTPEALSLLGGESVFSHGLEVEDKSAAEEIIRALCSRSGALLSALLCASMLLTERGRDRTKPARTIVQGAMSQNAVLMESIASHMARYGQSKLGLTHELVYANQVNYLGAAAALLRKNMDKA